MDVDAIVGLAVLAGALAGVIGLTLWSRRRIDRIAETGFRSARQIMREEEPQGGQEGADER